MLDSETDCTELQPRNLLAVPIARSLVYKQMWQAGVGLRRGKPAASYRDTATRRLCRLPRATCGDPLTLY